MPIIVPDPNVNNNNNQNGGGNVIPAVGAGNSVPIIPAPADGNTNNGGNVIPVNNNNNNNQANNQDNNQGNNQNNNIPIIPDTGSDDDDRVIIPVNPGGGVSNGDGNVASETDADENKGENDSYIITCFF